MANKIPAHFAKSSATSKTILYSHANAVDIEVGRPFIEFLSNNLGLNVFHYEYYGYSYISHEVPSEEKVYECAESAMEYLLKNENIKEEDIILMGTSLGSAASIHLASKYKNVHSAILECPFASIVKTRTNFVLGSVVDMFESYKKMGDVESRVLIIHGKLDTLVPIENGKLLYSLSKNANSRHLWIEDAGHNDILVKMGYHTYLGELRKFISQVTP